MKTISIAFLILLCTTFLSCKKDAVNQNASISYQLKTKNPSTVLGRTSGTLTWTSGYAYVTEIKFEAESDCKIESQSEIKKKFSTSNPQKIDLFAPLVVLGNLPVVPCDYRNAKIEIEIVPNGGNAALELTGTYNTTPVILRINSALEIEGAGGTKGITSGTEYVAITSLNLGLLTMGISGAELDAATLDSTGKILISATSNTNLYQKILNNFHDIDEEDFH